MSQEVFSHELYVTTYVYVKQFFLIFFKNELGGEKCLYGIVINMKMNKYMILDD